MDRLLEVLLEAANVTFEGLFGVFDVFGDVGQLITTGILLVLAIVVRSIAKGTAGSFIASFLVAVALYSLVLALDLSNWLALVLGIGVLGYGMFNIAGDARKESAWAWTAVSVLVLLCVVLAEISLLTINFPDRQLSRDFARLGDTLNDFLRMFFREAKEGAREVN